MVDWNTLKEMRNTPTGVGKTSFNPPNSECVRKHPHGRGEDPTLPPTTKPQQETPPRAWGRLYRLLKGGEDVGNTPTGVGKTLGYHSLNPYRWKHPHGRGEDLSLWIMTNSILETPPRAWGRRSLRNFFLKPPRNTPTGVGKTLASRPLWVAS